MNREKILFWYTEGDFLMGAADQNR